MKKNLFTGLKVVTLVALLAGCGPQGTSSVSEEPSVGDSTTISEPTVSETTSDSISVTTSEEVSVANPSLSITNIETTVWLDETLTILYEKAETEESVSFTSSDVLVATVDAAGVVTPVSRGSVIITAHLAVSTTIKDTITLEITDTVLDTAFGFGNIDYSNLKDENPSVATTKNNAEWPYVEGIFKNVLSQNYYVEASFDLTEINTGNTWNRISVGHRNVDTGSGYVFRGLQLSYGNGGGSKKTVMMETPNNWGIVTDRSQVWGQNGIENINFGVEGDKVTLGSLRDGNDYYYFIDGRLMWTETYDQRFLDVDTMPAFVLADMHAVISDFVVVTDAVLLDAMLGENETNRLLYPSYGANVNIDDNAKVITFVNANDSFPFTNIKDNAAKSLGDAFSLPRSVDSTLTFKFKIDRTVDPDIAVLALTLNQWGFANNFGPNRAISFTFGVNGGGVTGWDSNGDLPTTPEHPFSYPSALLETNVVTLTRTLVEGNTTFALTINGEAIAVTLGAPGYSDAFTMAFAAKMMDATITDYTVL